ncbi:DUF2505 domain-containing protein [Rhodococcoides corynebacterioides]|uniref:DUF2505 domain-containing protein n=1 Tax=Rhodococcoides corynebacterioides TaxID=53972 RepID=A0ABS7P607_9NOCA|nr:DUF2505 domain-containing protein [Rhodococcus corynebacterioides]MBY6367823.1 DUF2505 domain-containing protein [Rhodococcus corynebacterioides]MBY6408304.1 DUF2505 domain-containing protein [Rhodococcus corynebacterioides]
MSLSVEQCTAYPCSAARLHATLTDAEYWSDRVRDLGSGSRVVRHEVTSTLTVSEVDQTLDPAAVPKSLRRLVGSTMSARCLERWQPLRSDGSAVGDYRLVTAGVPVILAGDLELRPTGTDRCALIFRGTVEATMPVVGPALEKMMAGDVERGFEAEREFTMRWLVAQGTVPPTASVQSRHD